MRARLKNFFKFPFFPQWCNLLIEVVTLISIINIAKKKKGKRWGTEAMLTINEFEKLVK